MELINNLLRHDINHYVTVTDRGLAYLNAIDEVWAEKPLLLCRWHINKAVEAKIHSKGGEYA